MQPVEMPKANENLLEATLNQWLVKEGAVVAKDQPICNIITDKAAFDLPCPSAGVIRKIFAPERAMLPVGYILCALGEPAEALPSDYEKHNYALLDAHRLAAQAIAPTSAAAAAAAVSSENIRASPVARRLARENGIDLAEVVKLLGLTGPVNEKDVKVYMEKKMT